MQAAVNEWCVCYDRTTSWRWSSAIFACHAHSRSCRKLSAATSSRWRRRLSSAKNRPRSARTCGTSDTSELRFVPINMSSCCVVASDWEKCRRVTMTTISTPDFGLPCMTMMVAQLSGLDIGRWPWDFSLHVPDLWLTGDKCDRWQLCR